MQGQAGPFGGCPPRSRSAAEMDGCSRQNPAYRLATERAPLGALSICPFTIPLSPAIPSADRGRFWAAVRLVPPILARPGGWHFGRLHANMRSLMIVCALLPRFALSVATGGR